jgi:hypothetical protein
VVVIVEDLGFVLARQGDKTLIAEIAPLGTAFACTLKPFRTVVDSIENGNRLCNEPTILIADDGAIYVLSIDESAGSETG